MVIDDQFEQALPQQTASALAAAAQKAGFDLILCGDGSSDLYAQQVGLLVGEILNIPAVNGVSKIISLTADTLTVERELEDETETLSIPLPAVVAVSTDINSPQIPSMKAILGAAKSQSRYGRRRISVLTQRQPGQNNRLPRRNSASVSAS